MSSKRYIIYAAHVVSWLSFPAFYTLIIMWLLFQFTYLNYVSPAYRHAILVQVASFTILLPAVTIAFYRYLRGWPMHRMQKQDRRAVPYLISIAYYGVALYVLHHLCVISWLTGVVAGAIATQVVCLMLNTRLCVSTHCASIGGAFGALVAFSLHFGFNAVWGLILITLIGGMVGSARMIVSRHTLAEVVIGHVVGAVCSFMGIVM